jgi:serine phosphatase RsbU (regulator of sigma subunit)/Tfp pilus assembly protein PilF
MKNRLKFFLKSILVSFFAAFLPCSGAFPQDQRLIDSLKNAVTVAGNDTSKVKLFYAIGDQYRSTMIDTGLYYYREALKVAESINSKNYIAQCLIAVGANLRIKELFDNATEYFERALKISEEIGDREKITTIYLNIGHIDHDKGLYDKAIEDYSKALETAEKINFKKGLSRSYNSLGIVYYDQGSYEKSIESYLKALKIYEELGEKRDMAAAYNNIGLVHYDRGTYDKAIEYLRKSLALQEEIGDKRGMSLCYNNIGNIYNKQGFYEEAAEGYTKALLLFEELGNKRGISGSYHNLGETHLRKGSFDKATEFYLKALELYEQLGDKWGTAVTGISLANLNVSKADSAAETGGQKLIYLNQAISYGSKSLKDAMEMKLLPTVKDASNSLMTAYSKLGNYKKAIEFAGILISTQDSLFAEDKTRVIQEMNTRYETEKKQQQIELQESQLIAKDARIKQQKTFRNALIGGLSAIALIVIVIAYAYAQKRKDNKKITEQNEKIIKTNEELKELNETTNRQKDEIITSILYAQRIQSAILPPETDINELLKDNFIFYRPKDIVSGDFYWIRKVKQYIIVVSADCTGHGVPAAFMSMLGMSYLTEIVQRREVTQANQILNELRKQIKLSLRQTADKEESRDGMDIALCVIDSKKNTMQYSGAHNPLYIIKNNNGESLLREIKADPMPVGVHLSHDKPFTNHEIQLEAGDAFYIFSDGFIDQGGGHDNSRFTSAKFKKLLLEIHDQSMPEQKEKLEKSLGNWMGEYPQRDDILVIGVRVG